MNLDSRIDAFVRLGHFFNRIIGSSSSELKEAESLNAWFTNKNILLALDYWGCKLSYLHLKEWISDYKISNVSSEKRILIVMAGNIPMVGFHDLLSVLICGYTAVIKMSSKDNVLLPLIIKNLIGINSCFKQKVYFSENIQSRDFDAVIATGSDNTFHYFDYYFKDVPCIIRKNKRSLAILSGNESKEDLVSLSKDIFFYFGLGCRNVSFLFVPEEYDFKKLFNAFYSFNFVIDNYKYANNYDYNKAMCLFNSHRIIENGFIVLKEELSLYSPVAMLYFSYYKDSSLIDSFLNENKESIQCIVSEDHIPFGKSQSPELSDYADRVDVIKFLTNI